MVVQTSYQCDLNVAVCVNEQALNVSRMRTLPGRGRQRHRLTCVCQPVLIKINKLKKVSAPEINKIRAQSIKSSLLKSLWGQWSPHSLFKKIFAGFTWIITICDAEGGRSESESKKVSGLASHRPHNNYTCCSRLLPACFTAE